MLRFYKAIIFSPLCKSNFLASFSIKTCGREVLRFSEFINIVSIVFNLILLYTFLEISFD